MSGRTPSKSITANSKSRSNGAVSMLSQFIATLSSSDASLLDLIVVNTPYCYGDKLEHCRFKLEHIIRIVPKGVVLREDGRTPRAK